MTTQGERRRAQSRWADPKRRRPRRRQTPITFVEPLENRILLANTAAISTTLPTVVSTAGSALSFNGTNDYLITPNLQSSFTTTTVTVELWFKANAPGVILDELGTATVNSRSWHDSQIEILSSGQVDARVWDLSPVSLGTANF